MSLYVSGIITIIFVQEEIQEESNNLAQHGKEFHMGSQVEGKVNRGPIVCGLYGDTDDLDTVSKLLWER